MRTPDRTPATLLLQAVTETIETMVFMDVEPLETLPDPEDVRDPLKAFQLVVEPLPGEVGLIMPRSLAVRIVGALYGQDADGLDDQIVSDVVLELLNMVSGRLMKMLLPQDVSFKLGLPEMNAQMIDDTDTIMLAFEIGGEDSVCLVKAALGNYEQYL